MTGTSTVRCANDEVLVSLVCARGATVGTTLGTAATGLCVRKFEQRENNNKITELQRFQACHSIFTIKDGVVQSVSAIGTGGARCYTNESMRPGFSGSVNIQ